MWKKCLTKNWECVKLIKSLREQHISNQTKSVAVKSQISSGTLIIKQWNNPENSMNFHSKNLAEMLNLRNSKKAIERLHGTNLCFLGNKKPESFWQGNKHFNMRVWSWLRMNAGGVLNTCKSNEALSNKSSEELDCDLVADGWVTRG